MFSNVTRLKPRTGSFDSAVAAFGDGDFSLASEIAAACSEPGAFALHLRALGRSGGVAAVANILEREDLSKLSHFEAGELLALQFEGLTALGRHAEADRILPDARVRIYSSGSAVLECEMHYATAVSAWARNDAEGTKSGIRLALEVDQKMPSWSRPERPSMFTTRYWRARACELRALIELRERNVAGQAAWLTSAFAELDRAELTDRVIEGIMLTNLADIIGETNLPPLTEFVKRRIDLMKWNQFTNRFEYHVFSSLGQNHVITGDHLGALRCFRRSADVAPTQPLKVRALLDRSLLMREIGERFAADEELDFATKTCKSIDWQQAMHSERIVLVMLAEQTAHRDVKEARRLLDLYSGLKEVSGATLMSFGNEKHRAIEMRARAAVLRSEGEAQKATIAHLDELQLWNDLGFEYRAAAAALELAELTSEVHYINRVSDFARRHPQSWIARRIEKTLSSSGRQLAAV